MVAWSKAKPKLRSFGAFATTAAFMRLTWVQRLAPSLDAFADSPKVGAWRDTLLARPSAQHSVLPNLFEIFADAVKRNDTWLSRQ